MILLLISLFKLVALLDQRLQFLAIPQENRGINRALLSLDLALTLFFLLSVSVDSALTFLLGVLIVDLEVRGRL